MSAQDPAYGHVFMPVSELNLGILKLRNDAALPNRSVHFLAVLLSLLLLFDQKKLLFVILIS